MEKQSKNCTYKLMVVGEGGVGKTALLLLFTRMRDQYYPDDYDPNFEVTFAREVDVCDESCRLDLLDTTGGIGVPGTDADLQSQYWAGQVPTADGFLLVYAINSRQTFERLPATHAHILALLKMKKRNDDEGGANDEGDAPQVRPPAVVVVGSKCDLEDRREVHPDEARELARSFGGSYIETSAKAGINVDEAFIELVRQVQLQKARHRQRNSKAKTCLLS